MGQAFRRASGRIQTSSSINATTATPSSKTKIVVDSSPPLTAAVKTENSRATPPEFGAADSDDIPRVNTDNILEERDLKYDVMLSQMVGRIKAKPGGKLEMGEASVVEKYNRPMPRLRTTAPDSGRYEEYPAPPGTLNVAQIRHIMLLHIGKADDQSGCMDAHQIAEKFRVDVKEIERVLEFLALPPQDITKQTEKP